VKGIAVAAAAGLLIASFISTGTTRAQQADPDKKSKLTLSEVEAQVVTLQGQVATLQTAVSSLHPDDFAVVNSAGALNRGSASAVSATTTSTGDYEVTFDKDITACAYVATIGEIGTNPPEPGEIAVGNVGGDSDSVSVKTYDSTGTSANSPFHLSVSCP
jgi:hypothetical protein